MTQHDDFARHGQVVMVTGGGAGIGEALCREYAARGAKVGVVDIDAGAAQRVAGGLSQAMALPCDITDAAACAEAVAKVVAKWGRLDVLVNNAGISHHSLVAETTLAVVRRVMEVNFFGAVHCTQAALPQLVRSRGSVVALSSVAGFAPLLGRSAYAASKHALHGYFDTLRAEVRAAGVHVLVACPSYVRTEIDTRALAGDGGRFGGGKSIAGKLMEPRAVAVALVDAQQRRDERLLLSATSKAAYALHAVAPRWYETLMRRRS